jgi:hypothetical protein
MFDLINAVKTCGTPGLRIVGFGSLGDIWIDAKLCSLSAEKQTSRTITATSLR